MDQAAAAAVEILKQRAVEMDTPGTDCWGQILEADKCEDQSPGHLILSESVWGLLVKLGVFTKRHLLVCQSAFGLSVSLSAFGLLVNLSSVDTPVWCIPRGV